MRILRITAIVLILVALVLTGLFYQLGLGIENTVLNQSYYREVLDETDLVEELHEMLRENLPALMVEGMLEEMEQETGLELSEKMKQEMVEETEAQLAFMTDAFAEAFDPPWMEEQMLLLVDDFVAVSTGEKEELTAVIDLQERKEVFSRALSQELERISAEQLEGLGLPPELYEKMAEAIIEEMDLPESIALVDLMDEQAERELMQTLSTVRQMRSYYLFVPYFVFALLLLLVIVLAGLPGGFKLFGTGLLISGGILTVGLLLARGLFLAGIAAEIGNEIPLPVEELQEVLRLTIARFQVVSAVFAGAGLVIILAGITFKRRRVWAKQRNDSS